MSDKTGIEWTDATWNPVLGCSKVSPGCDNCYAISMSRRIEATGNPDYQGLTTADDWTGVVRCLPERLEQPLRWKKPRRIFVNSMSDLFHPDVPDLFIGQVFHIMAAASQHQFQVLTKRPQRMSGVLSATSWGLEPIYGWPLPNVWCGTSIESDKYVFRARYVAEAPAAVRFLSLEPLLGPLPSLDLEGIDWVIVGGESGPGARPMHRSWVREIRDQCLAAGVAFFYKQAGQWASYSDGELHADRLSNGLPEMIMDKNGLVLTEDEPCEMELEPTLFLRVGKKAAGRELDGRTWDEYPAHIGGGV